MTDIKRIDSSNVNTTLVENMPELGMSNPLNNNDTNIQQALTNNISSKDVEFSNQSKRNEIISKLKKELGSDFGFKAQPLTKSDFDKLSYKEKEEYIQNEKIIAALRESPQALDKTIKEQKVVLAKNLRQQFAKTKKEQGFIGKAWNEIKNIFSTKTSSNNVDITLNKLQEGKISATEAQEILANYQEGQKQSVDLTADLISGIGSFVSFSLAVGVGIAAAPFTGGASLGLIAVGFGIAATTGAALKIGLKKADALSGDRRYTGKDLLYDVATGGINGLFAPVTAGVGGAVGKAIATKVGVSAIREGGEIIAKNTICGTLTKTLLTTNVKYTGGTATTRTLCFGADMATNGAMAGGIDSSVRYLAGDDTKKSFAGLLQNSIQGTVGGFMLAPVIGGGMRLTGYGMGKITNNINQTLTFKRVFPNGINTAFKQGNVGDCYMLSTLESMLNNTNTAKIIKKSILTTPDGNYQVKIGNKTIIVAKNSISENVLADTQGVRIFEQAYRQLNDGALDGGFAEIVAKQFDLNPIHVVKKDLSDEIIEQLAKNQDNFILSAGFKKNGQKHYLSIKNIDTKNGTITLINPLDTSIVIKKSIADFKNEVISLDGGSINQAHLPTHKRRVTEKPFGGKTILQTEKDYLKTTLGGNYTDDELKVLQKLVNKNEALDLDLDTKIINALETYEQAFKKVNDDFQKIGIPFSTEHKKLLLAVCQKKNFSIEESADFLKTSLLKIEQEYSVNLTNTDMERVLALYSKHGFSLLDSATFVTSEKKYGWTYVLAEKSFIFDKKPVTKITCPGKHFIVSDTKNNVSIAEIPDMDWAAFHSAKQKSLIDSRSHGETGIKELLPYGLAKPSGCTHEIKTGGTYRLWGKVDENGVLNITHFWDHEDILYPLSPNERIIKQ